MVTLAEAGTVREAAAIVVNIAVIAVVVKLSVHLFSARCSRFLSALKVV